MPVATAESLGREFADLLATLKQPPNPRLVRVAYVTVDSVSSPYFTATFPDGYQATIPHGAITPIVGYVWRVRQILGSWVGDDASAQNYQP